MKRILILFSVFFCSVVYAATHLDTENRLWFTADVVKNAIVEFVPESKQQSVADLYQELMDQTTGKISVDSLFKVCRKAGFNTYKIEGFEQCKSFIQKMLTDAEIAQSVDLSGFCPGLDEKGNNPNKLRSITDKTRIGDFCSSTNIRMGQVIFKPGYNCSCMASVCNSGFEFQGGACVTKIAGHAGTCQRHAHSVSNQNNSLEKCQAFCEKNYSGQTCQFMSVVYDDTQCICSPTDAEIEKAYNALQEKIKNLQYRAVCDIKNPNPNDVCDKKTFNWVNVGRLQAEGLIEEHVRVNYDDTVHCNITDTRGKWNDDYVKCSSLKQDKYYEFKFDDIKESIDSDIQAGVVLGICNIHKMESNVIKPKYGDIKYVVQHVYNSVADKGCKSPCTPELEATAKHLGLTTETVGNFCKLENRSIKSTNAENQLARIDGIDNYIFYNGIQIQGSSNVITQLRQYIKSKGIPVRTFDCNKNVGEIKNSMLVGDDDVLSCMLNGQPIDFVFDDFSESWLYVQESGESAIQCIVSGGKYSGQECYGLTQKQCDDANTVFLSKYPDASGMYWDGSMCVLLDSNEAQKYDIAVQAGVGLIAAADCLLLTHTGCLILTVETAGLVMEITSGVEIENRAGEFLSVSTGCHARECAIDTIKNAGRVLSVSKALDAASATAVDQELARLVDYLEPTDLVDGDYDDWDSVVTSMGGDPNDPTGTAWVWLNRIGLGAQFASIGASGLRLTAKAFARLASKSTGVTSDVGALVRISDTSADGSRAAVVANSTGDVINVAPDVAKITDNFDFHPVIAEFRNSTRRGVILGRYHPDKFSGDLAVMAEEIFKRLNDFDNLSEADLRSLSTLMKQFDDAVAAAAHTTNTATDVLRSTNAASDAGRATNAANDVVRSTNTTSDVASSANTATRTAENATYIGRNMSSAEELATVGVREITTTNGRTVYQDMRNSNRFMSRDEVLRRIDELPGASTADNVATNANRAMSSAEELATVGVRETTTTNGRTVYQDMRNGYRFMSYDDVLRRIDELPGASTADNVATNANRAMSSAEELATVGVREITTPNGRTVYQDMRNGYRFMSYDEVLHRIDEL